jgi:Uma2 family endonuclease
MMSTLASQHLITADQLHLIATLPADARLFLPDVPWEEYEYLLSQITDSSSIRLHYDQGRLEIMTLSPRHERLKVLFGHFLAVLTESLGMKLIGLGSTTFKMPAAARGTEPDDCYYIRRADLIEDKDDLDLTVDPGPDLVVEIDLTHPSLDKMPIYASLGVIELWRYDGERMHFYLLAEEQYQEIASSDLFPFLTAAQLTEFLPATKFRNLIPLLQTFREWVALHKPQAGS